MDTPKIYRKYAVKWVQIETQDLRFLEKISLITDYNVKSIIFQISALKSIWSRSLIKCEPYILSENRFLIWFKVAFWNSTLPSITLSESVPAAA